MSILLDGLVVVARPADVGVKDRNCVGAGRISGLAVELVVEDRAHRAVGQGADLDGAHRCCFETFGAERPDQAHDAQAGAEALFRVRPALQDQLAQRGRGGTDRSGFLSDAFDGPVGVAPMARRHVIGHGGVPVITAGAQMRGDPLAFQKDLDGARRQPDLDLATGEAVGNAVEVSLDLDVVIDADPPPLGKRIGLVWQALEVWPIEFLEQRAAGDAQTTDRPLLVELPQQLADRRVEIGQRKEAAIAQPAEQPAFDDQNRRLDLRLT